MPDIVEFVPLATRKAADNLAVFIAMCRDDLTVFGDRLRWHENHWPEAGIAFGNLEQKSPKLDPKRAMREPFLTFAKAYFRHKQGQKRTLAKVEIRALKCLERALSEQGEGMDIGFMTLSTLDHAAELARAHFSRGVAYHVGRELERLSKFVSEKRLVPRYLDWRNAIKRAEDTIRTGKDALERREAKLPSTEAIDALAEIFAAKPSAHRDIFTTCTSAMLLCAPSRGSALLRLLENCEVIERKRDGSIAYGWRYPMDKGAAPTIKWVPDSMVDVAKEAVARLRDVTREGRRLAAWLERHPNKFYRHPHCPSVSEDQPLTAVEAGEALGLSFSSVQSCRNELKRHGLSTKCSAHTLQSLNLWIHANLPKDFPWLDKERQIRFSEALFCFRERQLRTDAVSSSPVLLARVSVNILNDDLGARTQNGEENSSSVFERHGYRRRDGKRIRVTSHQFRHLINTMAHRGGLGAAEIAKWSGRVDVRQNRSYDHMSEFELVDLLRSHDPSLSIDRPLAEIAERLAALIPITRQEFNTLTMPAAHVTEFGFCVHDFVMSPCQRFRDCLNCTEHVCIKGDRRIDRIRARYAQVLQLKDRAEKEIKEGSWGADRWYEIHVLTAKRLAELISILERADVPDGSVVRLRNEEEFSRIRMVLAEKSREALVSADRIQSSIPRLTTDGKTSN